MNTTTTVSRREGGRRARLAKRAAEPEINPCPPGPHGGRYRPLTESDTRKIVDAAFDLLSTLGMSEVPDRLSKALVAAGCTIDDRGRHLFPRSMIEDAIAVATKRFVLHGRDEDRSIEVGGDRVYFGTGGAAVQTLDLDSGLYRPSTLKDLHDFTRLADKLKNVAWFSRCCVATDAPTPWDLDVNTTYAVLRNTTKPVGVSITLAEHMPRIVQMLDRIAGGEGAFAKRPFMKVHISPIISPLRYGEDAVDVMYECMEHNIPMNCITAAQSGATAPATPAGFLAQSLAETLASLLVVYAVKPGHPMIFSNWPFVVDLRTGSFAGGGGETALLNAASAQLSNWLGLPSGIASSMTDAKAVDAQYGAEKGVTALAAGLAGGNLVYESSGMTASLLGASFEGFLLDDEMHSSIYRMMRGVEITEETLGLDAIREAVLGDGHFLGGAHTLAAMSRDFFYPKLADRNAPSAWEEEGALDAWSRANQQARAILDAPTPDYIAPALRAELVSEFGVWDPDITT